MPIWQVLVAVVVAALLIWWIVTIIRRNPESFTGPVLNKSFFTLGVIGLFLIVVIGFCVMMLGTT